MKLLTTAAMALALTATGAFANTEGCDDGEIVVKFAHVTNTDKHPKGIAAELLHDPHEDVSPNYGRESVILRVLRTQCPGALSESGKSILPHPCT